MNNKQETAKRKGSVAAKRLLGILAVLVCVLVVSSLTANVLAEGASSLSGTSEPVVITDGTTSLPEGSGEEGGNVPAEEPQANEPAAAARGSVGPQDADTYVQMTAFSSANAGAYVTAASNTTMLGINGTFQYTANTPSEGVLLSIVLQNAASLKVIPGEYYFNEPDPTAMTLGGGAALESVDVTDDTITVVLRLKGVAGSSGNFVINYPFNPAFNGWVADGSALASVSVNGEALVATPIAINVVSKATASLRAGMIFANNNNIIPGGSKIIRGTFFDRNEGTTDEQLSWRLQPGSALRVVLEYPEDAVLSSTNTYSAGVNGAAGASSTGIKTFVWDLGTANAGGTVPQGSGPWSSVDRYANRLDWRGMTLQFPADKFPLNSTIDTVKMYVEYTPFGGSATKLYANLPAFSVGEGIGHMLHNVFKLQGNTQTVLIDNPTQNSLYGGYGGIENAGTMPLPNTVFTWYNDPDRPANINFITLYNINVQFKHEVVVTLDDGTVYTVFLNQAALGDAVRFTPTALAPGRHIARVDIYPLDNPNDTVAQLTNGDATPNRTFIVNAGTTYYLYYNSWPDGKFPNGTAIKDGDVSKTWATLSWEGEDATTVASHTKPALDGGAPVGGVSTITMRDNNLNIQHVKYGYATPFPYVTYINTTGGNLAPGANVSTTVQFFNSQNYATGVWTKPMILVVPPEALTLDVSQKPHITNRDGTDFGTVTITEVTLSDGRRAYQITPDDPNFTADRTNSLSTTDVYFFQLNFKIRAGTAAGTYYLAERKKTTASAKTHGLLFGTTQGVGNKLPVVVGIESSPDFYNDSITDYDNNPSTNHLHMVGDASFAVAARQDLRVSAELRDATGGGWQDVQQSGASATVPLEGTGSIRLVMENVGNGYVGDITLLDILPQVGDRTAQNPTSAKGSQWDAYIDSLQVNIIDADGDSSVLPATNYTMQYSTNNNPTYSGGTGGINRTGTAAFANNGTVADARSFLLQLNSTYRLAPGCKIEVVITVKAPSNATDSQITDKAYNAFAVSAKHYLAGSGGAAVATAPVVEPNKQTFVLADAPNAGITSTGVVFKDYDKDGVYDLGEAYEGATVELYVKGETTALATTTTDASGQYTFEDLYAGTYVVKVVKPTGTAYSFAAATGVDANGYTPDIVVTPGSVTTVTHNAAIQVATKLTVLLKEGSTTHSTIVHIDGAALAANGTLAGNIVPGTTTGVDLPQNYRIAAGEDASKPYNLTWDAPSQTLVFELELANAELSYVFGGSTAYPITNPAAPIASEQVQIGSNIVNAAGYVAAPTRDGYTFGGWYTNSGFTSAVDASTTMPATGATLYAKWTAVDYTITYNYDGGTAPTTANPTGYTVEDLPVSIMNEPTKDGYEFAGWTGSNGTTAALTVSLAAGDFGDKSYTANWTAVNYTISYNYDGGTAPTTANPTGYTVEDLPVSIMNEPTKDGYEFAGWTGSNGTTAALTVSLAAGDFGNKSYTANWTAINYTISYNYDGGTAPTTANPTGYTVEGLPVSITNQPTKAGYDFAGWTGSNGTTAVLTVSLAVGDFGNKSYTANWTPADYTVSFNGNGANGGSMGGITVTYLTSTNLPTNTYTRTDYSFEGWATSAGGPVVYADGANYTQNETDDVTLYAVWKQVVFSVRFEDGDGNLIKEEKVNLGNNATPPTPPERYGYIFTEWSGNYTNVQKDELVVAVYKRDTNILPETVTVTFDYNDGRGTYTSVTVSFGDGQNNGLGANMPADPSGSSTFSGWNRTPDGNGAGFTAGTSVTSNITVYAQWNNGYYMLYFNLNGGEGNAPTAQSLRAGSLATAVAAPTRTGYTFEGWNTAADGSGSGWNFGSSTMPARNVTLYAQWSGGDSSVVTTTSATTSDTSSSTDTSDGSGTPDRTTGQDGSVSTINIGGSEIPLFGSNGHWGLLNLIFSGVGVLLALAALITYFTGRSERKKRLVTRIVAIAIAVASVAAVFITQNFTDTMALSDNWTALILALLVGEVVFVLLSRGRKISGDDDGDEELYGQASHSYTTD